MTRFKTNIFWNNKVTLGVIIFTLILFLSTIGKSSNQASISNDFSYKNEDTYFKNLTLKQGLEYINLKEKELENCFSNEIQVNKRNDVLLRFLVLLENYTVSFNDKLMKMLINKNYEESITTFNSELNLGKCFLFDEIEFKGIKNEKIFSRK